MTGTLYLVATPIGNLQDITYRAVETLKNVTVVACEDTRRTLNLLRYLGIDKPLIRYDEHTHEASSRKVISLLEEDKSVALVTDAGTPAVSDPGARLVQEVVKLGFTVTPIPGASSVVTAISASGFEDNSFVFLGFLPPRPGRARRELQETLGLGRNVVLFESPFRTEKTLEMIAQLVPQAPLVVGRELTKVHEEFIRGRAEEILAVWKTRPPKGEVVILIGQPARKAHDQ